MGYHIGLVLEVKGKTKLTKQKVEMNYSLEDYDEEIEKFDFSIFDSRTLVFSIKRKGYPYGGGFINSLIKDNDEFYIGAIKFFKTIHGKFNYDIINIYEDLFYND